MNRGLCGRGRAGQYASRNDAFPQAPVGGCDSPEGDSHMQWQTPTATDFRFGFEITMYVAAR